MDKFKLGYIVGSLAKASINRRLALALARLAPPELELVEIPIRDLPLYCYDFDGRELWHRDLGPHIVPVCRKRLSNRPLCRACSSPSNWRGRRRFRRQSPKQLVPDSGS